MNKTVYKITKPTTTTTQTAGVNDGLYFDGFSHTESAKDSARTWSAVDVKFKTDGDRSYSIRIFEPTTSYENNSIEDQANTNAEYFTSIAEQFIPFETLQKKVSGEFKSQKEFIDSINSALPKGYDKKEMEVVLLYGTNKNTGAVYLTLPKRVSSFTNGRFCRIKGDGDELGWNPNMDKFMVKPETNYTPSSGNQDSTVKASVSRWNKS